MSRKCHLVVVGFDEIVLNKYLELIDEAIKEDVLDGFSIVDLSKERDEIEKRLKRALILPCRKACISSAKGRKILPRCHNEKILFPSPLINSALSKGLDC